ncbi:5-oxoprolinase subunit PxpA [Anoxynatronum sibiricum]|uniref:5-oxoprolinase subunit A n=1 Tax=Anoxynatronum sibiricum TaxID=210623 RepID=A0ABU9VVZ3_9CLOT
MKQVDLNSDIGESFGAYKLGMDEEVLKYVSSANIACGWHAGDPMVMAETVKTAVSLGVEMGAHPGFPDLMGFGRRNLQVSPAEAQAYVIYQIGALAAFAAVQGTRLQHVKAHGALYNMAAKDPLLADAIAAAVEAVDPELILVGLAHSELTKAGEKRGLKVAHEVFADRAYNIDGTLVARTHPDAMIHDASLAVERVVQMVTAGTVKAVDGSTIDLTAHTICVHGDSPQALQFVATIREALQQASIAITTLAKLLVSST